MIDQERIGRAVEEILRAIGEDPRRDGIDRTPTRVATMYAELFSGIDQDPREFLTVSYDEGARGHRDHTGHSVYVRLRASSSSVLRIGSRWPTFRQGAL